MKNLLENDFLLTYGYRAGRDIDTISTDDPRFELKDLTNGQPLSFCSDGDGSFVNQRRYSITVYDFDRFISRCDPHGIFRSRCDYLMHDNENRHFIACEMSNTNLRFYTIHPRDGADVQGKREKAWVQLHNSVTKLCSVPSVQHYLDGFSKKTALFSYRMISRQLLLPSSTGASTGDNNNSPEGTVSLPAAAVATQPDPVSKSIGSFMNPTRVVENIRQKFICGFYLEQKLYPQPFNI